MTQSAPEGAYPSEPVGPAVANNGGLLQIKVTACGVTPLLMNAMSTETLLAIWEGPTAKKPRTRSRPKPREAAENALHRLPDGRPHVPLRALYASLINAGQFVRLDGKRQITTEKKTVLPGMLTILDTVVPLTKHDGRTPATWEVDIQQGRNPNGGEAVCLIRPRFDEWLFVFTIEIDQLCMPAQMARDLVDLAGRRIGLLEYRPQRKGTFGRFNVQRWEVLPQAEAA